MRDLEHLEERIKSETAELRELRMREKDEAFARRVRSVYDALLDRGFTPEQAIDIFLAILRKC